MTEKYYLFTRFILVIVIVLRTFQVYFTKLICLLLTTKSTEVAATFHMMQSMALGIGRENSISSLEKRKEMMRRQANQFQEFA